MFKDPGNNLRIKNNPAPLPFRWGLGLRGMEKQIFVVLIIYTEVYIGHGESFNLY